MEHEALVRETVLAFGLFMAILFCLAVQNEIVFPQNPPIESDNSRYLVAAKGVRPRTIIVVDSGKLGGLLMKTQVPSLDAEFIMAVYDTQTGFFTWIMVDQETFYRADIGKGCDPTDGVSTRAATQEPR